MTGGHYDDMQSEDPLGVISYGMVLPAMHYAIWVRTPPGAVKRASGAVLVRGERAGHARGCCHTIGASRCLTQATRGGAEIGYRYRGGVPTHSRAAPSYTVPLQRHTPHRSVCPS